MVTKMAGGYTRRDEIDMEKVKLIIDTVIEDSVSGIKMATGVAAINAGNKKILHQVFEKTIPVEDFKHLEVPYGISEDGIIFEYNNHVITYINDGDLLVVQEKDARTDIVISTSTIIIAQ